jgi:hypothetical protein
MAYFSPRGGLGHQATDPVEALREAEAEAEVVRREARLSRGDVPTRILVGLVIVGRSLARDDLAKRAPYRAQLGSLAPLGSHRLCARHEIVTAYFLIPHGADRHLGSS